MFELPVSQLEPHGEPRRRKRPRRVAMGDQAVPRLAARSRFACCSFMRASLCCILVLLTIVPVYMHIKSLLEPPAVQLAANAPSRVADRGSTFNSFQLSDAQFLELDRTWNRALGEAEVVETIQISHTGLAKKYVFLLEGNFVAMAKPLERDLLVWPRSIFSTLDWFAAAPRGAVRMDREYQGWGELGGLLLDRVLGMHRKPPIRGRHLSSELLYRHDYSLLGRVLYALPERPVAVSMHAWVHGMATRPPSNHVGDLLRLNDTTEVYGDTRERMLEYSDVLVFDFLIDDHDRFGNHNWKTSQDGKLLVWDSGLAWNYGPVHHNLDILCGTHQWNKMDPVGTPHYISRPNCKRVCVFREETIARLRSFQAEGVPSLGQVLKEEAEKDPLHPIFNSGIFNMKRSGFWWLFRSAVRFEEQNFFDGLDERVEVLLGHVDSCVEKYGAATVLKRGGG